MRPQFLILLSALLCVSCAGGPSNHKVIESKQLKKPNAKGKLSAKRPAAVALFQRDILECWKRRLRKVKSSAVKFRMEVRLKSNGYLAAKPKRVTPGSSVALNRAAQRARLAIISCQPFKVPRFAINNGEAKTIVTFKQPSK